MRDLLNHTLRNAPWALITSLCAGLSTYVIMLILSQNYGLAASGQFRLLLSITALIALASLVDSGKILVKAIVLGVKGIVRPLFVNRLKWSFLGMVAGIAVAAAMYHQGDELAVPVLVASVLMPVSEATRLFMPINQAKEQFRLNACYNVVKFGTLVGAVVLLVYWSATAGVIFVTYFVLTAAFHVFFLTRQAETFEAPMSEPQPYLSQSIKLSISGLFPAVAEHTDKFLISYFFGLETLGLYTIAVSTGRLALNFVKPVLTIFFGSLVKQVLNTGVLVAIFLMLTIVGVGLALLAKFYYIHVLPAEFQEGYLISAAILCGFGCYTIGVVSYYSAVLHRDSTIIIPTLANVFTFIALICYWTAALIWGGSWTLILFAVSYPLRELSNLTFISLLRSRLERS